METAAKIITYGTETLAECAVEAAPLLRLHFEEVNTFPDLKIEPDTEFYEVMEQQGYLKIFTVRSNGKLVGYAVFFVRPHPRHRSILHAVCDMIYIQPESRGVGMPFIQHCDSMLKNLGVDLCYHSVTMKKDFSPILERIGYECVEKYHVRRL